MTARRATPRFVEPLANELWAARAAARLVGSDPAALGAVTPEHGERIAAELYHALEQDGQPAIGFKLGAVDAATQRAFGVSEPFCAPLYGSGRPATLSLADFVAPALELEIGLVVEDAGATPVPCVEIIDSRIPAGSRTIATVVADFGLQGRIVFAEPVPGDVPERLIGRVLHDGRRRARVDSDLAATEAALELVRRRYGADALRPGRRIATGSLVPPIPLEPGTWTAQLEPLGEITLEVVP